MIRFVLCCTLLVAATASAGETALEDLAERIGRTWPIQNMRAADGVLTVHTDLARVERTAFSQIITAICLALPEAGLAIDLSEIAVRARGDGQGWVFESPNRCPEIANTPIRDLAVRVLGDSRVWHGERQ